MLTNSYTRSVPLNVSVAETAHDIMQLLLQRQTAIARIDYEPHLKPIGRKNLQAHPGPHLVEQLASMQPSINTSNDEINILLAYPATIRFLDLKRTKSGKKKRRYTAIYNRPLFGHIYGKGYSLTNMVNVTLQREFRSYFDSLQNVMKTIDLL